MKLMIRHSDKLVGAFVLVGTLFLVGALVFVGVNRRWFRSDLEYYSYFDTAKGLSAGLALEYRGFAIGRVKSIELGNGDQVRAVFSVHNEYADRIVAGSVVELAVQPLGFGANLVFYPGLAGGEPLLPGSMIESTDRPYGRSLVAEGKVDRPQRRDEMVTLMESLPPLVAKVETLVGDLDHMLVGLDRQILGEDGQPESGLLTTVTGTTRRFGDLAARADSLAAGLGPLLENVTVMAGNLADPQGLIPTLLGQEGTAAQLFRDDGKMFADLLRSVEELNALMAFLNESAPEISVLIEETSRNLAESEQVLQGLKNNPLLRGGIPERSTGSLNQGGYRGEGR